MKVDELNNVLLIMHDQNKYAESKNIALIVFSSALAFAIISNFGNIESIITYDKPLFSFPFIKDVFLYGISTFIVMLFISMLFSLLSFFPQIRQKPLENIKYNILFFENNAAFSSSLSAKEYYEKKYIDNNELQYDYYNQIFNLSIITKRKYAMFKISTIILFLSPIVSLIVIVVSYLLIG